VIEGMNSVRGYSDPEFLASTFEPRFYRFRKERSQQQPLSICDPSERQRAARERSNAIKKEIDIRDKRARRSSRMATVRTVPIVPLRQLLTSLSSLQSTGVKRCTPSKIPLNERLSNVSSAKLMQHASTMLRARVPRWQV
jgi:hypothetical protein